MDPIKDMMTQGASQIGMMNMQLATGLSSAITQAASGLNMMATQMTAAAPDLGAMVPAGMPGMPSMPGLAGAVPARAPAGAVPAPVMSPAFRTRMIR